MKDETEDKKCQHDLEPYRGQMLCKKCNRIIYCVTQPKARLRDFKVTNEKVTYTEGDIFNVLEED